jgi:hypothetical protein
MRAEAWARGHYPVLLALVNASAQVVPIGHARIGLLVTTTPYFLFTPGWPLPNRAAPLPVP